VRRISIAAILTAWLAIFPAAGLAPAPLRANPPPDDRAPTPEELRALVARVIAQQHRDDEAMGQYERVERRQIRKNEKDSAVREDRTFRVVPTGTGAVRVQTEENGRPVDSEVYRRQLRDVETALAAALTPNETRQKKAVEKSAKRSRDRAELLDAVLDAFTFTWQGRETRDGRTLAKIGLDPNPAFQPRSRTASLLARVRATVWVDEAAGQLARLDAEIIRDLTFGGGVFGKVYHGGRFAMEQTEIAPGIWLPTRYEYNYEGRKFVFSFEVHERTEASHYRRIGPPREALVAIRRELGRGSPAASNP